MPLSRPSQHVFSQPGATPSPAATPTTINPRLLLRRFVLRLKVDQLDRDDFVGFAAAAMNVQRQVTRYAAVNRSRGIEQEGSRSRYHVPVAVVVVAFHNVHLLTERGGFANDLPRLPQRCLVARDHRQSMTVLPQYSPPSAIFGAVFAPNVVARRLPLARVGTHPKSLPSVWHRTLHPPACSRVIAPGGRHCFGHERSDDAAGLWNCASV